MKFFLLPSLFLLLTLTTTAQSTKKQDIRQLMNLLKVELTMRNMVENGIEFFKKEKPAVPQQVWNDIRNKVTYVPYLSTVEQIFDAHYSQPEIKKLINTTKANPNKMPLLKSIVQQKLYDAGKLFGRNYGNVIKQTLKAKGY